MAWRGRDDATDEFDDYDPTPYGGGYDLTLTFGRGLPPSEETCYPISSSSGVDYDRPHYSSGSVSSTFGGGDYDTPECGNSDPKPKPQPTYSFQPQHEVEEGESGGYGGFGGRRPQPNPGYEYSGNQEYGGGRPNREDESEYGSGYGGGRPKREEESECGSGYGGGRPKRDEYRYDQHKPYGSEEGAGQGYGYGSGSKYQGGGGEYGYGGGQSYQADEHSYSSKPSYQGPSYGGEEEIGRYNKPSRYDRGEEYGRPSYGNSGYDPDRGEGYGRPSYGQGGNDYGEEKKHRRHHHRYTDDE